MTDTATLEKWLTEAETCLQKICMGQNAQAVGHDGKQVTYTPTDQATVRARIAELQNKLGISTGRKALRPFF